MSNEADPGDVYDRTVEDTTVMVPERHAAITACVIDPDKGMVLEYSPVQSDGSVHVSAEDGRRVQVVIPSDEALEGVE